MPYSFIDCSQNWLFSFDIKSGYHHIDIFPPDQEFLGFSWSKDGVIRFHKVTVLPFGISTGPYIFTEVLKPLYVIDVSRLLELLFIWMMT